MPLSRAAFTLVELSIVLVILGLLVGGVLAGQSLIRAAELRSISTDYQRFSTAIHAFRDKYLGLPGDIGNATAYWGKDNDTCPLDTGVANATTGTCNGNADGTIETITSPSGEPWRAWQQLGLAGLVEGEFTGRPGPNGAFHAITGTNIAKSRIGAAGYSFVGPRDIVHGGGYAHLFYADPSSTYLILGTAGGSTSNKLTWDAFLATEDAYNIDMKIDDGKPATGFVGATTNTVSPACSTSDANTATYNLSASVRNAPQCALSFNMKR